MDTELRRRLLGHIICRMDENMIEIACEAMEFMLSDANFDLSAELLQPMFANSDYWPCRMAAELLDLDSDEEYDDHELVAMFDTIELGPEPKGPSVDWKVEGF